MKGLPYRPPEALLCGCEHEPLTIVDVGARGGVQPQWRALTNCITWIGFEPDARSREVLTDLPARSHTLPIALSRERGQVRLYRTRDEGDSSLLAPNRRFLSQFGRPERFDVVDVVELDADTLDHQLASIRCEEVDVLKLDTQGSELYILEGAAETLSRGVIAVDVEVEFSQLYQDQPLFGDVDALLRRHELQLLDLAPRRWPLAAGERLDLVKGQVVWAEALYVPTIDKLVRQLAGVSVDARPVRLAKYCLVSLIYGFADFALAVLDAAAALVEPETRERFTHAVMQWDAESTTPRIPVSLELTPAQMRALRHAKARTGLKPTQQIRRLVEEWMKAEPR